MRQAIPADRIEAEHSVLRSENGKITSLVAAAVLLLFGNMITAARAQSAYPNVGDMPSRPDKPAMTADEQSKLKKELNEARKRQESQQKAKAGEARPKSRTPQEGKPSR